MHTGITVAVAALMGAPACGAAGEPSAAGEKGGAEEAGLSTRHFELSLDPEEPAIPQIVAAGRHELAAACADRPEAAVRIFDPLDPGAYADVPCTSVLDDAAAQDENAMPVSEGDEPTGGVQQAIGPICLLMCGLYAGGSLLTLRYAVSPRARTARARQQCDDTGLWGGVAMGLLCAVPF
ncbi:hypothetical protein WMF20_28165 [Sorangium sp. So ce834]|uniref:hypothetical protein n=1 Tax=Sorangium sp. So ce834 TaxID=3133321 RepID=UPI003F6332C7